MAESHSSLPKRIGQIVDARGCRVDQIDPVKLYLLNQWSIIPAETLRSMADQLVPRVRQQRLISVLSAAFTVVFVAGGTALYFHYFSTWTGFDPVSLTINAIQLIVIIAGPLIVFWSARAKYIKGVTAVMLQYRHCPGCGYNLRELPIDAEDGATVCPECGCAWRLGTSLAELPHSNEHEA